MATTTALLRPPTKWQIAKAVSGAVPAELSKSPVLGILGVVMGAGIVTLAGRLLSLGTADLKGSLGISYDDGAWIGAVPGSPALIVIEDASRIPPGVSAVQPPGLYVLVAP